MREFTFKYDVSESSPALSQFHKSNARFRLIEDVPGAEKACCAEILRRCLEQKVGTDGYRRSKWAVVSATYERLKTSALKTWLECFPSGHSIGHWKESESTFHVQFDDVIAEIIFISLDTRNGISKLCCLEVTGVWLNEVEEISREFEWSIEARIGRYPSHRMGGTNWQGIIANTRVPGIKWDVFREL